MIRADTKQLLDRCAECGAIAGFERVLWACEFRAPAVKAGCTECCYCVTARTEEESVIAWNQMQRERKRLCSKGS